MKINRKGFTLVELLVTIVIVGLVIGFTTFGIISVVNNSKEKAVILSENNLKEAARVYSSEISGDNWKETTKEYDAFCVTVGELMNKGLLDSNGIIKDKNIEKNTFIIVKRNNVTLSVINEEIVSQNDDNYDENNNVCTGNFSVPNEKVNPPTITSSSSLTDKIDFYFDYGSIVNEDNSLQTVTDGYSCLYGKSSSSINKEGFVNDNRCSFEGLENDTTYYVLLLMRTKKGTISSVYSELRTSDFVSPAFSQNKNVVEVTFDDSNVQNPSYYFNSTIDGTTNNDVRKCVLDRNGLFVCEENSIRNIEGNVWYMTSSKNVKINYSEENNTFDVNARMHDKSNNYIEVSNSFVINKYIIKFYKNNALSVGGKTDDYVERSCISGGNDSCEITSPSIEVKTGYSVIGFNANKNASTSSLNVNTKKLFNTNAVYYAITKPNSNISYVVNHWQQNIDAGTIQNSTNYTLKDTDNLTGTTDTSVSPSVKNYTGFTSPSVQTVTILGDGSTVVNYYYTRNSYTVTLSKGTGIGTVSGNGTYNYGKSVTIDATVKNGYTWSKWSGTHNTTTKSYTFTMPASNVSDTANANVIGYTITYNLNGGSVSGNTTSYNVETETFTLKNPTKTGYIFKGWTGTGLSSSSTNVTISKGSTGNRTYTANWEISSVIINDNKFACESSRRMAVYYVVSCTGSNCIYNTKNGLNSSYNFSLDTTGIPTWSINKSDYVDNVSDLSSMCPVEIMYITPGGANCRSSADSSGNVNNIKTSLSQCTAVAVYRTTMQYSNGGYSYWYYPYENCYMHESVLTSSDPCNSSCKTSSSTCEQYCNCLFGIQYSGEGDISSGCTCCSTGGIYQDQCVVT